MGDARFAALNEKQQECLRLAAQGYTSKEIARKLGIHYRTVDQRLDRARKLLGAPDRAALARAFVAREGGYDPVIYDRPVLAGFESNEDTGGDPNDRFHDTLFEPQVKLRAEPFSWSAALNPFSGSIPDEFGPIQRLLFILRLGLLLPMALGSLSLGLLLVIKLVRAIGF